MNDLWTWVDTPYAVHEDMSNHRGGSISMDIGTLHIRLLKKK